MAEEKKVSDQKPNVFVRIGRWFKSLPNKVKQEKPKLVSPHRWDGAKLKIM